MKSRLKVRGRMSLLSSSLHLESEPGWMEELWRAVGAFGPYQWLVLASLPLAVLASGGNFLLSSFLILEPHWACSSLSEDPQPEFGRNCSILHSCPESDLQFKSSFYSIGEEWGLLCEDSWISHSILSLSNVPTWFGLLFWGPISDGYGRKNAAFLSTLITLAVNLGSLLSPNWQTFTAFRMLFGFAFAGVSQVFIVWAMELTDQSHGFLVNSLTHWHYTYMIVALLAWKTRSWRSYVLALNLICSPILFLYAFLFTESPRWLIHRGRSSEALSVLGYVHAWNKGSQSELKLSPADLREAEPVEPEGKGSSRNFLSLFQGRKRAIQTSALGITFCCAAIASGTVILDVGELAGGAFQNLFLIGFFRVFTPFVSVALDWKLPNFGRRPFFFAAQALVLTCFLSVLAAQNLPSSLGPSLAATFSLAGAICNMFVWIVIVQFAFEMYPTLLKNTALAYTGLADNTGSILVPQIVYLRRFWRGGPISIAVAGILISTTLGYFLYPETKGSSSHVLDLNKIGSDSKPLLVEDSEEEDLAL